MTTTTVELTVEGMHCASCGLLIDDTVEDLEGVATCSTDVRRRTTRVELDPTVVTAPEVAAAIAALGYRARMPGDAE